MSAWQQRDAEAKHKAALAAAAASTAAGGEDSALADDGAAAFAAAAAAIDSTDDEAAGEALLTTEAPLLPHPSSLAHAHRMLGLGRSLKRDEVIVAVSVTRAMKYVGGPMAFTHDDAEKLLRKKLSRLLGARVGVHPALGWTRAILHVWSEHPRITRILEETLADATRIPPRLWRTAIVLVTSAEPRLMHHM